MGNFAELVGHVVLVVIVLSLMFAMAPLFAGIALAFVAIYTVGFRLYGKRAPDAAVRRQEAEARYVAATEEGLAALYSVRVQAGLRGVMDRFARALAAYLREGFALYKLTLLFQGGFTTVITAASEVAVLLAGTWLILRGGVYLTFTDHPLWAEVRAGTLIVFYNAEDRPNLPTHFPDDALDPEDFVLAQWGGLGNAGDSLVLLDAEGRLVDGLSYADRSGQLPQIPNVGRGQAAGYVGSTPEGVNDPALWVIVPDAPGGSTPGTPNSEENRAWIERLRRRAEE